MEATPRLPMLSFDLKRSPDYVEFGPVLKQYIKTHYGEDPALYNKPCTDLEQLRQETTQVVCDYLGCTTLKKYYAQLQFLQGRFPMKEGEEAAIPFTWEDVQTGRDHIGDIKFEQACVLYNIGSLHSLLGVLDTRQNAEGMKVSCTHFQCAAWAFEYLRDNFGSSSMSTDMSFELLSFHILLMLSQAQECILEKSMLDGRKNNITAKVAAQVVDFYRLAIAAIDTCDAKNQINARMHKEWRKRMNVKMTFYQCITYYYQGRQSEEMEKHGECLAFYTGAKDKLTEVCKLAKNEVAEISESLNYCQNVVMGKYNSAKKDNDFIYHEKVPALDSLPEVKGASLVKGIPFNPNDKEISGQDIFQKLVPMEAHEASSVYSEEKAKLLRGVKGSVEQKDMELDQFMSSLQLDMEQLMPKPDTMPEHLMEKCAAMSVRTDAIQDLTDSMAAVSGLATEVELGINEIQELIDTDTTRTEQFEEQYGRKKPSVVLPGLLSELMGYRERHKEGSQLNNTLQRAMNKHTNNLKTLTRPPSEIITLLPPSQPSLSPEEESVVTEVRRLLLKVTEMKEQRKDFLDKLTDQLHNDDITNALVTQDMADKDQLYADQLKKHDSLVQHINMNMSAQEKILRSLTDANAKFALIRQSFAKAVTERERSVQELILSYEKYEDLLAKCAKGSDYNKKLWDNVNKTLERCRSECRVRQEERDMLISRFAPKAAAPSRPIAPKPGAGSAPTFTNQAVPIAPTLQQPVDVTDPSGVQTVDPDVLGTFPTANLPAAFEGPKLKDYLPFMKPRSFGPKTSGATPSSSTSIPPLSPSVPSESPLPPDFKQPPGDMEANLASILPASIAQYIASSVAPSMSFPKPNVSNQLVINSSQASTGTPPLHHPNMGSYQQRTAVHSDGSMQYPTNPVSQQQQYPQNIIPPMNQTGAGYPRMPHPSTSVSTTNPTVPMPKNQQQLPHLQQTHPQSSLPSANPNQIHNTNIANPAGANTFPASANSPTGNQFPSHQQQQQQQQQQLQQQQQQPHQLQQHLHPPASGYNTRPDITNTVSASDIPVLSSGKDLTPATTPISQQQHQHYQQQQQPGAAYRQPSPHQYYQQQHPQQPVIPKQPQLPPTQQQPQYQQQTPYSSSSYQGSTQTPSTLPSNGGTINYPNYNQQQPLPQQQRGSQPTPSYQNIPATPHPQHQLPPTQPQGKYQTTPRNQQAISSNSSAYGLNPHTNASYGYAQSNNPQHLGQNTQPPQQYLGQQYQGQNIPNQQTPGQNLQSQQIPQQNIHSQQIPQQNIHSQQIPQQNIHSQQITQQNIHSQQIPRQNLQSQQTPGQNLQSQQNPGQNLQSQQTPGQNLQSQQIPQQNIHSQQIPGRNVQSPQLPGQSGPRYQTPAQNVPNHQIPGQNVPSPSQNIQTQQQRGQTPPMHPHYPSQNTPGVTHSPHGSPIKMNNTNMPVTGTLIQNTAPTATLTQGQNPVAYHHQQPYNQQQQQQHHLYQQQQQYPNQPPKGQVWMSTPPATNPTTTQIPAVMSTTASNMTNPSQQQGLVGSNRHPSAQQNQPQLPASSANVMAYQPSQMTTNPQQQQQQQKLGPAANSTTQAVNNNVYHQNQGYINNYSPNKQPQQLGMTQQQQHPQLQQQQQHPYHQQQQQAQQLPNFYQPSQHPPTAACNTHPPSGMYGGQVAMSQPLQPQPLSKPLPPQQPPPPPQQQQPTAIPPTTGQQLHPGQAQTQGPPSSPVPAPRVITPAPATPPMSIGRQNSSLDDILSSSPNNCAVDSLPIRPQVLTDQERQLEKEQAKKNLSHPTSGTEPYDTQTSLHKLLSDVEAFGQLMDGLTTSILGVSRLDSLWKGLLDSQESSHKKQSMAIARCYPMKNRDPDIMPYDETRVVLTTTKDDYINASWLNDLAPSCPKFISTQSPLHQTCVEFWTMVYEQGTEVLVQITSEYETGKKFPVYYPTEREKPVEQGHLIISLQSVKFRQSWVERIVYLKNNVTKQGRTVVHLQFKGWPVSGFPDDVTSIVRFISEVHNFYKQQRSLTKPIIVHCGTGVGRCGVLVVVYASIQELVHGNSLVDIPGLSKRLLHKRKGILVNKEQLFCAYQCLLCFAEEYLSKRGILVKNPHFSNASSSSSSSKDTTNTTGTSRDREGSTNQSTGHVVDDIIFGTVDIKTIRANVGLLNVHPDKDKKQPIVSTTENVTTNTTTAAFTSDKDLTGTGNGVDVVCPGMSSLPDVVQQHSAGSTDNIRLSNTTSSSDQSVFSGSDSVTACHEMVSGNVTHTQPSAFTATIQPGNEKEMTNSDAIKSSLAQLQDPTTFTLGSPEKQRPRITKANFNQEEGRLTNTTSGVEDDDPLASLNPMWSLKK